MFVPATPRIQDWPSIIKGARARWAVFGRNLFPLKKFAQIFGKINLKPRKCTKLHTTITRRGTLKFSLRLTKHRGKTWASLVALRTPQIWRSLMAHGVALKIWFSPFIYKGTFQKEWFIIFWFPIAKFSTKAISHSRSGWRWLLLIDFWCLISDRDHPRSCRQCHRRVSRVFPGTISTGTHPLTWLWDRFGHCGSAGKAPAFKCLPSWPRRRLMGRIGPFPMHQIHHYLGCGRDHDPV